MVRRPLRGLGPRAPRRELDPQGQVLPVGGPPLGLAGKPGPVLRVPPGRNSCRWSPAKQARVSGAELPERSGLPCETLRERSERAIAIFEMCCDLLLSPVLGAFRAAV